MPIKLLLDENVNPLYQIGLLMQEPDAIVWRVADPAAPPLGTLDPEILSWCEEHEFLLITNNRASMPGHLRDHLALGRHTPGIVVLNPHMGIGATIQDLRVIAVASLASEHQDRIVRLPL